MFQPFVVRCSICQRPMEPSDSLNESAALQQLYSEHPELQNGLYSPRCRGCSMSQQNMAQQPQK
jgi:hypothetical protein